MISSTRHGRGKTSARAVSGAREPSTAGRRVFGLALVILLAFLVVLISRFPARWVVGWLPEGIGCRSVNGTLWSGSCQGLTMNGMSLADLTTWTLYPSRLLTGRLSARIEAVKAAASMGADVEVTPSGRVTARDVEIHLPLDPNVLPELPRSWRGVVHGRLSLLRMRGKVVTDLQGDIQIRDLVYVTRDALPFGSYAVTFPAAGADGDDETEPVGQLRDTGGPLAVEGTVRLARTAEVVLEGLVAARSDASPGHLQLLQFLGTPDAQGRRTFSTALGY